MIKVYLDNNVVSAITWHDCDAVEIDAIEMIRAWHNAGKIVLVTSRHTVREMERAPAERQDKLKSKVATMGIVDDDHRIHGFHTEADRRTCTSYPLVSDVVDPTLFAALKTAGLDNNDGKHLMYAAHNQADVFLTLDKDFLGRKLALENLCPKKRIQKPSEFVGEWAAAFT
jgi:predicted nucleic acid-binding protein